MITYFLVSFVDLIVVILGLVVFVVLAANLDLVALAVAPNSNGRKITGRKNRLKTTQE